MNKIVNLFFIFSLALKAIGQPMLVLPSRDADQVKYKTYLKEQKKISYIDWYIQEQDLTSSRIEEILIRSEHWLSNDVSINTLEADILSLQEKRMLSASERLLFFDIFQKKVSQSSAEKESRYFTQKLCWIYGNDRSLWHEFPNFDPLCRNKTLDNSEIKKLFKDYEYLITDGNLIDLNTKSGVKFNDNPQSWTLLSSQKEPLSLFGKIDDLLQSHPSEKEFFATGNCESAQSKAISGPVNFEIYYDDNCIRAGVTEKSHGKESSFFKKYSSEIIAAIVLGSTAAYFLKDHELTISNYGAIKM
jgi:hypothetical protein